MWREDSDCTWAKTLEPGMCVSLYRPVLNRSQGGRGQEPAANLLLDMTQSYLALLAWGRRVS